jgi:hypothetical protein
LTAQCTVRVQGGGGGSGRVALGNTILYTELKPWKERLKIVGCDEEEV